MVQLRRYQHRSMIVLSLALVLSACASLPSPELPEDTLLILPITHTNDMTDRGYFGWAEVQISSAKIDRTYRTSSSRILAIRGIGTGTTTIRYRWGFDVPDGQESATNWRPLDTVTARPGVNYANMELAVQQYSTSNAFGVRAVPEPLTDSRRREIEAGFSDDEVYAAWVAIGSN